MKQEKSYSLRAYAASELPLEVDQNDLESKNLRHSLKKLREAKILLQCEIFSGNKKTNLLTSESLLRIIVRFIEKMQSFRIYPIIPISCS